jgi:hypothetical protein
VCARRASLSLVVTFLPPTQSFSPTASSLSPLLSPIVLDGTHAIQCKVHDIVLCFIIIYSSQIAQKLIRHPNRQVGSSLAIASFPAMAYPDEHMPDANEGSFLKYLYETDSEEEEEEEDEMLEQFFAAHSRWKTEWKWKWKP